MNVDSGGYSEEFNRLMADFLQAIQSGEPAGRNLLLREYPELARELSSFLAAHDFVKGESVEATLPLGPGGIRAASMRAPVAEDQLSAARVRHFDDYELLEEVARGGMGVVFKARQKKLNRIVAVKMILSGQFASDDDVRRFHTEAEAAANLDHAGIVPIYEIGEHEGQHFFSMGFVEGENLAEKIKDGPLSPVKAAELVTKIAEAIAFAHQRGVIHRDLKPANVLLDQKGEPKVTDFGLAKKLDGDDGLTASGQILGTPSYMPPEQAAGKPATAAADIYALGAIFYCLLTGRPPFQAANPLDTLMQTLEEEPIPPRRLNTMVPIDAESICLKCLRKNPNQRYASAAELVDDLKRFLRGETVDAERSQTWQRAWTAMLGETRHQEVMAHWGRVWMWHSMQIFVVFAATNLLVWLGVRSVTAYLSLWSLGLVSLLPAMWYYRFRDGIPLTPIERQLGQLWGLFAVAVVVTGVVQHLMGFEPLQLLPVMAIECGLAFGCMAAILGGSFYPMAALCVGLGFLLAYAPQVGPLAFGCAFGVGLFIPGWKFANKRVE